MRLAALALLPALLAAQDVPRPSPAYRVSIATLVGTSAAEVAVSATMPTRPGLRETNGWLRNADGGYATGKGVALKAATTGGILAVQWAVLRFAPERDKRMFRRVFTWLNFSWSGAQVGITAHNYRLR